MYGKRHGAVFALVLIAAIAGCGRQNGRESGEAALQGQDGSERRIDASDVRLPEGYRIEMVADGLTFPTGVAFDDRGVAHVVESGYAYGEVWTTPRLLRIESDGSIAVIATGTKNGPWNGVEWQDGAFLVAEGGEMEGGRILRITPDGNVSSLIDDLPSVGDHHTNGPAVGPDGWIYFGQGTATNSGVVGPDNYRFGWLKRYPDFHDIPGQDITLTGVNYESDNPLNPGEKAVTGAFVPFGRPTKEGQVIRGGLPCNGAVMRIRPDGGGLELVAWGFRNPYALAFYGDRLFVLNNSYDDRGSRPVFASGDALWEVRKGTWYGWPDYDADLPLESDYYDQPGHPRPQSLIRNHPNIPPRPVAVFGVHSSCNGIDFPGEGFGFAGEAFVAQFGDNAPNTGKLRAPVGYKVVRVNLDSGVITDFAVNRGEKGPASRTEGGGLERPVSLRFDNTGTALYVVDFGIMNQTEQGPNPRPGTGVLWKITREAN